jgi:hypothetical protein
MLKTGIEFHKNRISASLKSHFGFAIIAFYPRDYCILSSRLLHFRFAKNTPSPPLSGSRHNPETRRDKFPATFQG